MQSGNYDSSGYYDQNVAPAAPYDQYNDQPNVNVNVGVSFGSFQRQLAPHGSWSYNSRWGDVWRPRAAGFRPYFDGYWANTREYGVVWVSNDPWGDVTSHYGRWVFDPRDGWLWVPGYVWGPSWVVWRSGGGQIGWFPMPPDDYYGNGPYRGRYDNYYGYRDWYGPSFGNDTFFSLWIFVGEDRFSDRNYRNYVRPAARAQHDHREHHRSDELRDGQQLHRQSQRQRRARRARLQPALRAGGSPQRDAPRICRHAGCGGPPDRAARTPRASDPGQRQCQCRQWQRQQRTPNAAAAREDARDARQDAREDVRDARQDNARTRVAVRTSRSNATRVAPSLRTHRVRRAAITRPIVAKSAGKSASTTANASRRRRMRTPRSRTALPNAMRAIPSDERSDERTASVAERAANVLSSVAATTRTRSSPRLRAERGRSCAGRQPCDDA